MGHIFISYSHKDSDYVHRVQEALQKEGFDAWIDDRIDYGDEWLKVIQKHLDECDAFVIVMSNNSFESDMVQNEVTRAREKRKPIFPLLLGGDNWLIVQAKQFVDVRDRSLPTEKFYRRLEAVTPRKNERAEREAAERAAQEKAKREAAEKAEHEKTEKLAKDKLERDAAEKARQEKIERESAERIARQQEERENGKRYKRERAEHRAAQIDKLKQTIATTLESLITNIVKEFPRFRVVGFAGIAIALFWLAWKNIPTPPLLIAASPSASSRIVPPTKTLTLTPNPTKTHLFTQTPSFTPTITMTPTPIPSRKILFQRNFEDGNVGASSKDGTWAVVQEPDGNHCLSGSGPAVGTPQIWYYKPKQTNLAYILEIRVKFVQGHTLYILFPSKPQSTEHYGVALNDYGLSLMHTWSMIGRNFPLLPYPDRWYTLRVEIQGDSSISVYIDNLLFEEYSLQPPIIDQDVIGYVIDGQVCLDDIKVWTLK